MKPLFPTVLVSLVLAYHVSRPQAQESLDRVTPIAETERESAPVVIDEGQGDTSNGNGSHGEGPLPREQQADGGKTGAFDTLEKPVKDEGAVQKNANETSAVDELKIFRLEHSDATAARELLLTLFPVESRDDRLKITADVRTNSLVVRCPRDLFERVAALLLTLDERTAAERTAAATIEAVRTDRRPQNGPKTRESLARDEWLASLETAADPEWVVSRVADEFHRHDQQAAGLAQQYRTAQSRMKEGSPQLLKLKLQLETTVKAAFDARQKVQAYEVDRLRRRLARVEVRIAARDQMQGAIVQARIEELLNPEKRWDVEEDGGQTTSGRDSLRLVDGNNRLAGGRDAQNETVSAQRRDDTGRDRKPGETADRVLRDATTKSSLPESAGSTRRTLLDAEAAIAVARVTVAEAGKQVELSHVEFERIGEEFKKGSLPHSTLRTAESRLVAERARLQRAQLDLEHAEGQAQLAREDLAAHVRLLKIDLDNAGLRLQEAANIDARAGSLSENKAITKAQHEQIRFALRQAELEAQRAATLLELYRQALPEQKPAAGTKPAGKQPKSGSADRDDRGIPEQK